LATNFDKIIHNYGKITYKKYCSLFAGNGALSEQMKQELKDYKTSKGTTRFTTEKPLLDELVSEIVRIWMK